MLFVKNYRNTSIDKLLICIITTEKPQSYQIYNYSFKIVKKLNFVLIELF